MREIEKCVFCDETKQQERVIRAERLFMSFVSKPWFRDGHCLVVPKRHIEKVSELTSEESSTVMAELGRLSMGLDRGFGSGIMQKFHPLQTENGIKVNHLHFHVFPRLASDEMVFPVPEPNTYQGFVDPTLTQIDDLVRSLK